MHISFVDLSREALHTANRTFAALELDNEADFVQADVHELPFRDDYADFVMSRGSIWFWDRPHEGLREIHRVLKPGGVAVVGGGLGRYIPASMRKRLRTGIQQHLVEAGETRPSEEEFRTIVERARLPTYTIITEGPGGGGKWVEIRKP
jgi:ubiquinone/menaquinone biosynthesis C-methylase UbiE